MGQWRHVWWFAVVVMLTGCMTTQRQARQESVVPILEERIARLEERVVAMEAQQRQVEELDWRGFPAPEEEAEPLVIQSTDSSARAATGGGAASYVKPSSQEIQRALKAAGYYHGSVDGKIGPKTKAAIRQFQKDHGLVSDGKVGRATWGALGKYLES